MHRHGRNAAYVALTAALTLALTLGLTGCTNSSTPHHTASAPPTTPTQSTPSTPTSSSSAPPIGQSGPPTVAHPTVPPDVPRTGPNLHPGDTPPLMPLQATQHTAAGAKAFAEFFIKTIDWAYATISGVYPAHYAEKSCVGCQSFIVGIEKARKAHHRYIGGRFTVVGAKSGPAASLGAVTVTVNGTAFEELTAHGEFVSGDPAHHGLRFAIQSIWTPNRWQAAKLAVLT